MLNTLPTFLKSPSTGTALGATDPTHGATASRSAATADHGDFAAVLQHQADQRLAEQRQAAQRSATAPSAAPEPVAKPNPTPTPSAAPSASKPAESTPKASAPAPQTTGAQRSEQPHSEAAAKPEEAGATSAAPTPSPGAQQAPAGAVPASPSQADAAGAAPVQDGSTLPSALTAIQVALLAASPSATGLHPWSALAAQANDPGQGPAPVTLPAVTLDTAMPAISAKARKRELPATELGDDASAEGLAATAAAATDTSAMQPWLQAQALVASLPAETPAGPLASHADAANDALPSTADLARAGQRQRAAQAGAAVASPRAGQARAEAALAQDPTAAGSALAPTASALAATRANASATEAADNSGLDEAQRPTEAPGAGPALSTGATALAASTAMAQTALQAGAAQTATSNSTLVADAAVESTTAQVSEATAPSRRTPADAHNASAAAGTAPAAAQASAAAATANTTSAPVGEAADRVKAEAAAPSPRGQATSTADAERNTSAPGLAIAERAGAGPSPRGDTGSQDSPPRDQAARPDTARDTTAMPPVQGLAAPANAVSGTHAADAPGRAVEALGATNNAATPVGGNANLPQATGTVATPANPGLATPAAAEVRIPVPLDSPAFAPALGAQVSLLAKDGVQTARLQLNPAEMGPITVQIAVEGSGARVDFSAERAGTREAIEASLPALAGALQDAGLTLTGGGVFQQSPGHQPQQQPQPGQAPFNPTPGATLRGQDTSTTLAANAGMPTPRRGLVDLVA
jgi:flagellar hook-length control protein FliK